MRAIVFLAASMALAVPAMAQMPGPPGPASPLDQAMADLNQDWMAENIARDHVAKALQAYVAQAKGSADAESRLKWVLDNWVGKEPAEAKK
jgi:hypothetical protein